MQSSARPTCKYASAAECHENRQRIRLLWERKQQEKLEEAYAILSRKYSKHCDHGVLFFFKKHLHFIAYLQVKSIFNDVIAHPDSGDYLRKILRDFEIPRVIARFASGKNNKLPSFLF